MGVTSGYAHRIKRKPDRLAASHPGRALSLYRSERHWRTQRNLEIFSAVKFVQADVPELV